MSFFREAVKTAPEPEVKQDAVVGGFNTVTAAEWYARNGYYFDQFGSYSTDVGITVSEEKALELGAFYAGVRIIAEDMGSLPFFLYERSPDGAQLEKLKAHPLWSVLHGMVNPFMASGEFVEMLTSHALIGLDGFARIERYDGKRRIKLIPWQPAEVTTVKDSRNRTLYIRKRGTEAEKTHKASDVFHIRGFSFDGLRGDRIISRARHTLGLGLGLQKYAGTFFANDVSASLFLTHPQKLGVEGVQNVIKAYQKKQGLEHAGEPFVLQQGGDAKRLDPDMEKMQLLEARKEAVREVARLLRLPLYKLADLDRAIQSNIEQQAREYAQHTLSPWIRRWKEAVRRCLLTTDEQLADRIYAEHSVEALQRGDFKGQAEAYRALLEKGVWSINEVRKWFNMNPVSGGDEHRVQINMQAISETAKALLEEMLLEAKRQANLQADQKEILAYLENGGSGQ